MAPQHILSLAAHRHLLLHGTRDRAWAFASSAWYDRVIEPISRSLDIYSEAHECTSRQSALPSTTPPSAQADQMLELLHAARAERDPYLTRMDAEPYFEPYRNRPSLSGAAEGDESRKPSRVMSTDTHHDHHTALGTRHSFHLFVALVIKPIPTTNAAAPAVSRAGRFDAFVNRRRTACAAFFFVTYARESTSCRAPFTRLVSNSLVNANTVKGVMMRFTT
jgi:hypothetical protein